MNQNAFNIPAVSVVLGILPWFYPLLCELMTPKMTMAAAPLVYLSWLASVVLAVMVLRRKAGSGGRAAVVALVLDLLFIALSVYSAFTVPW